MNHFITSQTLTANRLNSLFASIDSTPRRSSQLKEKLLASLFYEPSTRTRLSFEAAMIQQGGGVISTENALQFSSHAKGETLADTIRVVSSYCDVIVLRHPVKGSAGIAAFHSKVPVINAGDGSGEHPTQAIVDAYCVYKRFNRVAGLCVAVVGDLLHGRTVHSLVKLLAKYENNTIVLINHPLLPLPQDIHQEISKTCQVKQFHDLTDGLRCLPDVIYMTRTQSERAEGTPIKPTLILDTSVIKMLKEDCIVLHPLPRNEEIDSKLDSDPRMWYFKQAEYGLNVRKALLKTIFN